ncbi:hypothetical protein TNCV_4409351 [Trichonephila clavipes]|nr:hypothetical protein TNCV_4409351 [Trichonephila clavipes]
MQEKGGNRWVPGPDYMVDALKFPIKLPEFLESHYRRVWPGVVLMEYNTSSVDQFWPFLFHQIHSTTFLDVSPVWPPFEELHHALTTIGFTQYCCM